MLDWSSLELTWNADVLLVIFIELVLDGCYDVVKFAGQPCFNQAAGTAAGEIPASL